MDWEKIANITTSLGIIVAIAALGYQINSSYKAEEFSVFVKLVESYQRIIEKRRETWSKILETIRSNPKTEHEITDKTNSLEYLTLRSNQTESFYAIEFELIEYEIQSLNMLNVLCEYSTKEEKRATLIKALFAAEISFYQNNISSLLRLREIAKNYRTLSIPNYDNLIKFEIGDFFEGKR